MARRCPLAVLLVASPVPVDVDSFPAAWLGTGPCDAERTGRAAPGEEGVEETVRSVLGKIRMLLCQDDT